jgi:hypothetical protein
LHMLGKHSATELHPQSMISFNIQSQCSSKPAQALGKDG